MSLTMVMETTGVAGNTITEAATDASQNLDSGSSLAMKNSDDKLITALLITVTGNDLKFCIGSTPVQSGLGHVLTTDQSLFLRNAANIRAFNYINDTNGSNSVLMMTPFYGVTNV